MESVIKQIDITADQAEAAVELLTRQGMLVATGTPAHSVKLTAEGWKLATAR